MSVGAAPSTTLRTLNAHEFNRLMSACGNWGDAPRIAVAVSGGPDSIALTYLLYEWVSKRGGTLHAFTVDHQLRDESSSEALQLQAWCKRKAIPHEIFAWGKDDTTHSSLHEHARKARYDLLFAACHKHQIQHLFLAHHADDQAETVLMRMMKDSGADGLAAMPSTRTINGITLHRPLLPVLKQRLVDTCMANDWGYFTDPSNASTKYLRGQLRSQAAPLAAQGLTTSHLYEIARNAGMKRAEFEIKVNAWLTAHASVNQFGVIELNLTAWKLLDTELQSRVLIRVLLCISGEDYPPRSVSLEALIDNLVKSAGVDQTLSGCRIILTDNTLRIFREAQAIPAQTIFENEMLWDNRFKIIMEQKQIDKTLSIRPLGNISRDALEKNGFAQAAACNALWRATLPALYADDELYCVPEFVADLAAPEISQATVKAIFLPQRMLILEPFHTCPPLCP